MLLYSEKHSYGLTKRETSQANQKFRIRIFFVHKSVLGIIKTRKIIKPVKKPNEFSNHFLRHMLCVYFELM